MNYEELYKNLTALEKGIKDRQTAGAKNYRNLCKHSEIGDLKSYAKDLELLKTAVAEQNELLAELTAALEGFDAKAYVDGGDFAEQMVYECRQLGVDVKGDSPVYEMFPYKVRIDAENQDVFVDRKKWQRLRPISFAKQIKESREKLFKAPFDAAAFVDELCVAYDTAVAVKNKKIPDAPDDINILLRDLHRLLAPMQRYRRDYDAQAYSFDLARLYSSDERIAKDGRKLDFGTSKDSKKFIRILDAEGREQQLSTIRFYREQ